MTQSTKVAPARPLLPAHFAMGDCTDPVIRGRAGGDVLALHAHAVRAGRRRCTCAGIGDLARGRGVPGRKSCLDAQSARPAGGLLRRRNRVPATRDHRWRRVAARHRAKARAFTTCLSKMASASASTISISIRPMPRRVGRPSMGGRIARSSLANITSTGSTLTSSRRSWRTRRRTSTGRSSGTACYYVDACTIAAERRRAGRRDRGARSGGAWWIAAYGRDGKDRAFTTDSSENRLKAAYLRGPEAFREFVREMRSDEREGEGL